jgi:hypothetical protein
MNAKTIGVLLVSAFVGTLLGVWYIDYKGAQALINPPASS